MKKTIYLFIFVVLGLLVAFMIYTWVEVWHIGLLTGNFSKYCLSLTWDQWQIIYRVFSLISLLIGGLIGFHQGKYWWHKIYER